MSYSRADMVAGKTPPNPQTPAGLQTGEMTLRERQDYNVWIIQQRPLNELEAQLFGYREDEIRDYFHSKSKYEVIPGESGRYSLKLVEERPVVVEPPPAPVRNAFNRIAPTLEKEKPTGFDQVKARAMGFTGDICVNCAGVRVVKNGNCLLCTECGNTSGCS